MSRYRLIKNTLLLSEIIRIHSRHGPRSFKFRFVVIRLTTQNDRAELHHEASFTLKTQITGNSSNIEAYFEEFTKCRRVLLCVAEQRTLPSDIMGDCTRKRRTVIQLPGGEQRELPDEWGVNQTRIQGLNCERRQGASRSSTVRTRKKGSDHVAGSMQRQLR